MLLRLPFIGHFWFERRQSAVPSGAPWFERVIDRGEHLFWFGKLHVAFTPRGVLGT